MLLFLNASKLAIRSLRIFIICSLISTFCKRYLFLQGLKINSSTLQNPILLLLRRLALALIILGLARILFWIVNASQFEYTGVVDFVGVMFWGSYFDLITLFYILLPFILLHLIPHPFFEGLIFEKILKLYFISMMAFLLILTGVDAGYFPFSKTRINVGLFKMAGHENVKLSKYVFDYIWFVPPILGVLFCAWKGYPKTKKCVNLRIYKQVILNIVFVGLLILTVRGGFRLKPLRSVDSALFVPQSHAQLVVSSGFNFLESLLGESIKIPVYFDKKQMKGIMKGDYYACRQMKAGPNKNIVILILESFGKEYTFPATGTAVSHSPFLVQLAKQSAFYSHAYSNGTRSVDAIPAILEGVPKLTKTDFMYSNYLSNITPGFPFYLKKEGYNCSFYHGGKNGTLGFEAFLKSRGWLYSGKDQYSGLKADFDGQWGIFDGPYLQFVAKELSDKKSPFVAAVFTLSSHHPYTLPAQYSDSFKAISEPMHKTIRYTDQCLSQFFKAIEKEPWFKETIFIITGDHSGQNFSKFYQRSDRKYEVPLLVYDPSNPQPTVNTNIIQHSDIVPLGLDKIGFTGKIFTLGTYFETADKKMAFQNEDGNYQAITQKYCFSFNGKNFKLQHTSLEKQSMVSDTLQYILKSKIQNYYYRMVHNKYY